MKRIRFTVNKKEVKDDYRPVIFMTKYPFWCSGENDTDFILIGYADSEEQVMTQWPEAKEIEVLADDCQVEFSSRFPRPSWYTEKENEIKKGMCCWNCKHRLKLLPVNPKAMNKSRYCKVLEKSVRVSSFRIVIRKCCEFDDNDQLNKGTEK